MQVSITKQQVNWVAYTQQKHIVHSSGAGSPRSEYWYNRVLVQTAAFSGFLTYWKGLEKSVGSLIPLMKALPLWLNHLPKTPPPNTITFGTRISTYGFWEHTNIQPIARMFWIISTLTEFLQMSEFSMNGKSEEPGVRQMGLRCHPLSFTICMS